MCNMEFGHLQLYQKIKKTVSFKVTLDTLLNNLRFVTSDKLTDTRSVFSLASQDTPEVMCVSQGVSESADREFTEVWR